jgi:hypothetical protein
MRIEAIQLPNGQVINLSNEEQIDILMAFSYSIFKQLIYDNYPPPPESQIKTPEEGFARHLAMFTHYYITEIMKRKPDDESLRH